MSVVEQLLTRAEAARRLGISLSTLDRLLATGELPVVRVFSRTPRVRESALIAFIEARCADGAAASERVESPEREEDARVTLDDFLFTQGRVRARAEDLCGAFGAAVVLELLSQLPALERGQIRMPSLNRIEERLRTQSAAVSGGEG